MLCVCFETREREDQGDLSPGLDVEKGLELRESSYAYRMVSS